jgi:hypothetical protein
VIYATKTIGMMPDSRTSKNQQRFWEIVATCFILRRGKMNNPPPMATHGGSASA